MGPVASIQAHGIVGDGRSAALVSSDGTVDWLCWPRFDSQATFAALLHDASAGEWRTRPMGRWESSQEYVPGTNVLVTRFRRPDAVVTVTDFMPVASEEEERRLLLPEHELIRIIECEEGSCEVELFLRLAPGFATRKVTARQRRPGEICYETPRGAFFLRSERPLKCTSDSTTAQFGLQAGESVRTSLSWSPEGPAVLGPLREGSDAALERTLRFWRSWVKAARYDGPYQEAVQRSALALKLLQYPPSGAFLAAATTSLPERLGGALNWDYRYCWLRDSAFTARCLYGLGYRSEADAFVYWLMHTTQLTQPRLAVLYDVYGNSPRPERTLDHLDGYAGSRPVRTGNGADSQVQLDLHGEIIDAICAYVDAGGELDRESRKALRGFGRFIAENWQRPDASLWEYRTEPEHHTHSKVLCWTALDGLLRLEAKGKLPRLDVPELRRVREEIAAAIRSEAVDPDSGAYVATFGGTTPDSALLLLPWYGFEPAASPRMRATLRSVVDTLGTGEGLLFRNPRLKAEGDGAFLVCSFWAVECLADGAGSLEEAEAWFEALLGHLGPLGLLAEEVDARTGQALGNFPQAYSHVGLISAALAIEERRARVQRSSRRSVPAQKFPEVRA